MAKRGLGGISIEDECSRYRAQALCCYRLGDAVIEELPVEPAVLRSFGLPSTFDEEGATDAAALTIAVTPLVLFHELADIVDDFVRSQQGRSDRSGVLAPTLMVVCISHVTGLRTVIIKKDFLKYHLAFLNTG